LTHLPQKIPTKAAAIDLGKVRVGLAVADELGLLAHPRPFLDGRDTARVLATLKALIHAEQITLILVGHPRTLKGYEGREARQARAFAAELGRTASVQVELVDERLSTREAASRLRQQGLDARAQRSRVDSAAAAILLQSWLDSRQGRADE
jgi:putative Holliday junction resolvase